MIDTLISGTLQTTELTNKQIINNHCKIGYYELSELRILTYTYLLYGTTALEGL